MKTDASMIRRWAVILIALGVSVWLGGGGLLAAPQGNNAADPDMFLISFHGSVDRALVDEYRGEVWIMYPPASKISVWMTPEAAEALAEHEAVEHVDRQLSDVLRPDLLQCSGCSGSVHSTEL